MSFSDLVSGGAECGPSNPLATFGKRFGQDRGAQMDRYSEGAEASGSSRQMVSDDAFFFSKELGGAKRKFFFLFWLTIEPSL